MRQYLILFLLFLFQLTYAPILPKEYQYNPQKVEKLNVVKLEQKLDSIDLKYTEKLNINKFFTKSNRRQVRQIAKEIGIESKWLYQIFYVECLKFGDIHKTNPYSNATGLIGFLPSTAQYLGTSTEEIQKMSMHQQLNLTHKYLKIMAKDKEIKNEVDLYLLIFRSTALGKPDNYIIGEKDSQISEQNPIFRNESGTITVKDIRNFISNI